MTPEIETLPAPKEAAPPRPPKSPKRTAAPAAPKGKPRRRKEWWQ